MEYQVDKEFIIEAHKAACSDWKTKIEKKFPEAFPKIQTGKWYKKSGTGFLFFLQEIEEGDFNNYKAYGFNNSGEWSESKGRSIECFKEIATEEEVKEALKIETIKRYGSDWRSVKIKDHAGNGVWTLGLNTREFIPVIYCHAVYCENGVLYNNGTWADILEEPKVIVPKEKALKFLAKKYNTTVDKIEIQ